MQAELKPIRERRQAWEKRLPEVYEMLHVGCEKAQKKAAETLRAVRHAMKIDYFEGNNLLKQLEIFTQKQEQRRSFISLRRYFLWQDIFFQFS